MRPEFSKLVGLLRRAPAHLVLIALLGFLVYSNTFSVPFQWDDNSGFLLQNPFVRDAGYFFDPSPLKGTREYAAVERRTVSYFTFALNWWLGGTDVRGYHLFNLAVHVANGLLVYLLVVVTFQTPFLSGSAVKGQRGFIALFSALLFVSHPVQTEAVTYIFQRHASLMAFFYMASVAAYASSRLAAGKTERYGLYAASLFSAVLAMKTKENAATLPVAVALYEFFFFAAPREGEPAAPDVRFQLSRLSARILSAGALTRLVPFFLVSLLVPLSVLGGPAPAPSDEGYASLSRWSYLVTEFRVFSTYIRLLFFPVNQNIAHDFPVFTSVLNARVLLSLGLLVVLFFLAVWLFLRSKSGDPALRLGAFGALWFFVSLSVESTVVPIPMVINEYRLYLPSAGAIIGITSLAALCSLRLGEAVNKDMALAGVLVIAALSTATLARNRIWRSETGLWEDAAGKSPGVALVHYNLGNALWKAGDKAVAVEHFAEAARLAPDYADAHFNLGVAYLEKGMLDESIKHYEAALKLRPGDAKAHTNIGNAYWRRGLRDKALVHFKEAVRLDPGSPAAHVNLGNVYVGTGEKEKAAEEFRQAVRLDPANAVAHFNLAGLYDELGQKDRAAEEMQTALRLDPSIAGQRAASAGVRGKAEESNRLGLESFQAGRLKEAVGHFERAAELDPGYAEAYYNLGVAYQNMGMLDMAIDHYLKGLALRPDAPLIHNNLGLAYMGKRAFDDAVRHFTAALRLKPDYAEARYNLGNAYIAKGDAGAAAAEYAKTVKLRPDFAEAHNNLGLAYMTGGRLAEAKAAFLTALRLKPDSAGTHFNLGLLHMRENDREAARREFEAALKIDPGMAKAREALEKLKG